MHIFSKFNAYNTNAHTHTHMRTNTHMHRVVYQGNGMEEKAFKKRKVFKEDLKEVTDIPGFPSGSVHNDHQLFQNKSYLHQAPEDARCCEH